jgi:hypothetical protein
MRRRFMVMFILATLAVGLGWQATASAYGPHAAYITTNKSTVDPGDSLTINCRYFIPHESVVFTVDGVYIGSTYTNSRGSCSLTVTVPKNTTPGGYTIVATGKKGDSATTHITVLKPPPPHHHHQRPRRPARHWWDFFF